MDTNDKLDYETPVWAGDTEKLVTVATFSSSTEAAPLRVALEDAGISTFITDENMATAIGGPAFGWVRVQVPESQAEAAKQIAKEHQPVKPEREEERELEKPTKCLACGAEMPEESDTCPKCGWTFNVTEGTEDEQEQSSE